MRSRVTVVGFHTAFERFIRVDALWPSDVDCIREEQVYADGKGVQVAQTIGALGEPMPGGGLIEENHRPFVAPRMRERDVLFYGRLHIEGERRPSMALQEAGGSITEIATNVFQVWNGFDSCRHREGTASILPNGDDLCVSS